MLWHQHYAIVLLSLLTAASLTMTSLFWEYQHLFAHLPSVPLRQRLAEILAPCAPVLHTYDMMFRLLVLVSKQCAWSTLPKIQFVTLKLAFLLLKDSKVGHTV